MVKQRILALPIKDLSISLFFDQMQSLLVYRFHTEDQLQADIGLVTNVLPANFWPVGHSVLSSYSSS